MASPSSLPIGLPRLPSEKLEVTKSKSISDLNRNKSVVEFLLSSSIFKNLESAEIKKIAKRCEFISLNKDADLFKEGDKGDAAYIVESGEVTAYNKVLNIVFGINSLFGEIALFIENGSRSLSVKANCESMLLKISGDKFRAVVLNNLSVLKRFTIKIINTVRMLNQSNLGITVEPRGRSAFEFKEQELYECVRDLLCIFRMIRDSTAIEAFIHKLGEYCQVTLGENITLKKALAHIEQEIKGHQAELAQAEPMESSVESKKKKDVITASLNKAVKFKTALKAYSILYLEPLEFYYYILQKLLMTDIHSKCSSLLELAQYLRHLKERANAHQECAAMEAILLQHFNRLFSSPNIIDARSAVKLLFICVQVPCLYGYFDVLNGICKNYYQPKLDSAENKKIYREYQLALLMRFAITRAKDHKYTPFISMLDDVETLIKELEIFNSTELLEGISFTNKMDVYANAEKIKCIKGEVLIRQGDSGDSMFYVWRGRAVVKVETKSKQTTLGGKSEIYTTTDIKAYKVSGEYFGDQALIDGQKRSATVEVISDDAELLKITRKQFNKVLKYNKQVFIGLIRDYFKFITACNSRATNRSDILAIDLQENTSETVGDESNLKVKSPRGKKTPAEHSELEEIGLFLKGKDIFSKLNEVAKAYPILSLQKNLEELYKFERVWKEIPQDMNNLYGIPGLPTDPQSKQTIATIPLTEMFRSLFYNPEYNPCSISINSELIHSIYNPQTFMSYEEITSHFLTKITEAMPEGSRPDIQTLKEQITPLIEFWKVQKNSVTREQSIKFPLFCEEIARGCTNNAWAPADSLIRTTLNTINVSEGTSTMHFQTAIPTAVALEIDIPEKVENSSVTQSKYIVFLNPETRSTNRFDIHAIILFKWQLFPYENPSRGVLRIAPHGIILGPNFKISESFIVLLKQLLKRWI